MALTSRFRDTVRERARHDAAFRRAILVETINEFLAGEIGSGKSMLRDLIHASMGWTKLSRSAQIPSSSLQRMLSSSGNPTATKLFRVIEVLRNHERMTLEVRIRR